MFSEPSKTSQPDPAPAFASNPHFAIRSTSYGGRGAYATNSIPSGTIVLACAGPYASVVLRKFKKEVCAWCFRYAFSEGKGKWAVKPKSEAGVWFCCEACMKDWMRVYEVLNGNGEGEVDGKGAVWWLELLAAYEKAVSVVGKLPEDKSSTDNTKAEDITQQYVDSAWSVAHNLVSEEQTRPKKFNSEWQEQLNEFELDTIRFLLDGLSRKTIESLGASLDNPGVFPATSPFSTGTGSWSDFLGLQNNEIPHLRSKPYTLASHIRIYRFLVWLLSSATRRKSTKLDSITPPSTSPVALMREQLLASPDDVRALLGRDPANVFGIWEDTPDDEESEMFGWGAYVFGSYFNHDCSPNLRKKRAGRTVTFHTTKDVREGEELCISYVETAESVVERNTQLEDWFFQCGCKRCGEERVGG